MPLKVEGTVKQPLELGFEDLASFPDQIEDVSLLVPKRSGSAVPLHSLLAQASVENRARYLTVASADGSFAASVPLDAVADSALIVYRIGNEPLPESKGGPFRFLIPNAAACHQAEIDTCANVKYVGRLTLSVERGVDTRPDTPTDHKALHEVPGHEHLKDPN
jgi:2-dehydropantoate 2-reductase